MTSTTFIRAAFLVEAAGNLFGAAAMLLYPDAIVKLVTPTGISTATSASFMQWMGALVVGLTPQLFLVFPDTPRAIASRPLVYWTLFAGEAALVPLMLWQLLQGNGGLTTNALLLSAAPGATKKE
ncbi:hypothetical protein MRB53_039544 [Persea americana]|nr:hypothetical protein MRB53_039544 [Persea americana]